MADLNAPIYKLVNRKWKTLPTKGDSVGINDPKAKDGYLGDLTKKTVTELEELLRRQDKVLENKIFISKLKDKGKKLADRREEFRETLQMVRNAVTPLEVLDPKSLAAYEWTGKLEPVKNVDKNESATDDNTLKLIVNHDVDVPTTKTNYVSCMKFDDNDEEDPSLAIQKELERLDIQDSSIEKHKNDDAIQKEDFGSKTLRNQEQIQKLNLNKRPPFKPFKTKTPWKPKEENNKNKFLWQESSATGVLITNNPVSLIPLKESYNLQIDHQRKEKERHQFEAIARLTRIKGINIDMPSDFNKSSFSQYRDRNDERHVLEYSDDEEEESDLLYDSLKLVRADEQ